MIACYRISVHCSLYQTRWGTCTHLQACGMTIMLSVKTETKMCLLLCKDTSYIHNNSEQIPLTSGLLIHSGGTFKSKFYWNIKFESYKSMFHLNMIMPKFWRHISMSSLFLSMSSLVLLWNNFSQPVYLFLESNVRPLMK